MARAAIAGGADLRRTWLRWRFRLFQRRRHRHLVLERVDGMPMVVLPEVFNPTLFGSSQALARRLAELPLSGRDVLDVGTGSGLQAIVAARRGARVVAVDILPQVVRCARINALLNHVEPDVEVLQGDLFTPVSGRRFDLVLFNPPFYRGEPREPWEYAWRSENALDRFAAGLRDVLKPGSRALLVVSSDVADVDQTAERHHLRSRAIWERDLISERLMVLEWTPAEGDES